MGARTEDPSAALVIIGNEILSGKLTDLNAPFLLKELFGLGVGVRRVTTIPDEVDVIAAAVREAADSADFVLTSGGIGPTHDDVTIEGVARAFDVPLVTDPDLHQLLVDWFGDAMTPAARRMALVPEGTRLLWREGMRYPQVVCRNVYIFPGVPEFLRRKFLAIKDEFRGRPYHLVEIRTRQTEDILAYPLEETVREFAGVDIGSYPHFEGEAPWVLLTLQSKEAGLLERARAFLCDRLDPEALIDGGCVKPPVR